MKRRELREQIFKLLFQIEFYEDAELPEQLRLYFEEMPPVDEKSRQYIEEKYARIIAQLPDIDETIEAVSKGWKVNRMGKVDLAIMRLACFEIKYDEDVPTGVAINEAVELSKLFGGEDSASFVNGVLAKMA